MEADLASTAKAQLRRASAVALWAGAQLVALAVAAAGVHLWPHQPEPPESLALAELVVVQMTTAALLFPRLFFDRFTTAVAIALILPFQALAGLLSATRWGVVAETAGTTAVWVGGLAALASACRRPRDARVAQPLAVLITIGGPLLFYARAEALAAAGGSPPSPERYGPLTAVITLTTDAPVEPAFLLAVGVPLVSAGIFAATRFTQPSVGGAT